VKLSQIDLNLLVALDALLTERNVSRASELMATSQPHMSRLLGRLRRIFNDELLVRVGHEYQLTPLAADLGLPVKSILRQIEETIDHRLEFHPAKDQHTFNIAASEYATFVVLRPLIKALLHEAPNVSLRIRGVTGNPTIERLEAGDLDVGIWTDRVRPPHLLSERLLADRIVCLVDNESRVEKLDREAHLALPKAGDLWEQEDFTGLANASEVALSVEGPTPIQINGSLLKLFLLSGTGLGTLTQERLAKQICAATSLRIVELPGPEMPVNLTLYWNPNKSNDPALTWLRGRIRSLCKAL
jgi:DNA-binding transcriptional LysR family regulator